VRPVQEKGAALSTSAAARDAALGAANFRGCGWSIIRREKMEKGGYALGGEIPNDRVLTPQV